MTKQLALQYVVCWKRLVITSFLAHFIYWKTFFQVWQGLAERLNLSRILTSINRCKSKSLEVAKDSLNNLKKIYTENYRNLTLFWKNPRKSVWQIWWKNMRNQCETILKQDFLEQHATFKSNFDFLYRVATNVIITFVLRIWEIWS